MEYAHAIFYGARLDHFPMNVLAVIDWSWQEFFFDAVQIIMVEITFAYASHNFPDAISV